MQKRVGLIVGRFQPLHLGHIATLTKMISEMETVIVAIGSSQEYRTARNPFHWEERKTMLRNVCGDRVRIIPVEDIGAVDGTDEWVDYLIERLRRLNQPEPTDYYCGGEIDAKWYVGHFGLPLVNRIERSSGAPEKIKAIMAQRGLSIEEFATLAQTTVEDAQLILEGKPTETILESALGRRLHVVHRDRNIFPNGTEIRTLVELRDNRWRQLVPEVNCDLIEAKYPWDLRVALEVEELPLAADYPHGFRVLSTANEPPQLYENLTGWRPVSQSRAAQLVRSA